MFLFPILIFRHLYEKHFALNISNPKLSTPKVCTIIMLQLFHLKNSTEEWRDSTDPLKNSTIPNHLKLIMKVIHATTPFNPHVLIRS